MGSRGRAGRGDRGDCLPLPAWFWLWLLLSRSQRCGLGQAMLGLLFSRLSALQTSQRKTKASWGPVLLCSTRVQYLESAQVLDLSSELFWAALQGRALDENLACKAGAAG